MMLNSRFELSKIERKIESGKRILSCHSRKSRVEREFCLATFENREWNQFQSINCIFAKATPKDFLIDKDF